MLAWMVYAMLATAALGVTAWLVDFAVAGRLGRRRVLWAGVFLASAVGPVVFSVTRGVPAAVAEEGVGAAPAASGRREPIVSDRVLISAWLAMSAVFALWLVATQRRGGEHRVAHPREHHCDASSSRFCSSFLIRRSSSGEMSSSESRRFTSSSREP